jgi:hypothetical protein
MPSEQVSELRKLLGREPVAEAASNELERLAAKVAEAVKLADKIGEALERHHKDLMGIEGDYKNLTGLLGSLQDFAQHVAAKQ